MSDGEGTLSIALLSGTDDKLQAAAVLTGARRRWAARSTSCCSTGRWTLPRRTLMKDHGVAPEAGATDAAVSDPG